MRIRRLVKQIVPPFLYDAVRRGGRVGIVWTGDYPDWHSACLHSRGYDDPEILARALSAARKVKQGKALFERDATLFHQEKIEWHLACHLLRVACRERGCLRVLDFGGSLGSTYFQHKRLLADIPDLSWSVVEQKPVADAGEKEFQDNVLRFYPGIPDAKKRCRYDVVLFSSVLQYLEFPYHTLGQAADVGASCMLLQRTTMIPGDQGRDRICVQNVEDGTAGLSYPCRLLSLKKIMDHLGKLGYRLEDDRPGFESEHYRNVEFHDLAFNQKKCLTSSI